jgi:hypothetical protein
MRGCMTLPKSAFKWLHEAANRQRNGEHIVLGLSIRTRAARG